jgi:hypothetical protein
MGLNFGNANRLIAEHCQGKAGRRGTLFKIGQVGRRTGTPQARVPALDRFIPRAEDRDARVRARLRSIKAALAGVWPHAKGKEARMLYYFNVIEGCREFADPEGTELPSEEAAQEEAGVIALELLREFPGRFGRDCILEVISEAGQRIMARPILSSP